MSEAGAAGHAPAPPPITVRYRDDDVVVVSKPAGLLVHRSAEARDRQFLLQRLRDQLGCHLHPVHRLDRATSGLVAFALSPAAARHLQEGLARPDTVKEYLTLVRGETEPDFESRRPLTSDAGVRQEAHTTFRLLATFSRCSLLVARLHTGRRQQIRRHLDHLAHQVIGDTTHGKGRINRLFRERYGLPRLFLHAWRLRWFHEPAGRWLDLVDPLPPDLCAFLERLPDLPADLLARFAGPTPPA